MRYIFKQKGLFGKVLVIKDDPESKRIKLTQTIMIEGKYYKIKKMTEKSNLTIKVIVEETIETDD